VLEHYELLKTKRIRDGFYILGDELAKLIGKEITKEEYDYFATNEQAYATYRDDLWPSLEQHKGLERPEAKPYGIIFDRGSEYPITKLNEVWRQARGFIFTEKLDDGDDCRELSNFGWTIIAGGGLAGFPTRQIRQLLRADTRPILAFHDADRSGEGIYRALGFETRRTRHLDIALGERVTDLGLSEEDAKALGLRSRPEPPKYKGLPRWETSALSVLTTRLGVDNPKRAYVVAKMIKLGVKISPTPIPRAEALRIELWYKLSKLLEPITREVAKKYSSVEGETVGVQTPEVGGVEVPGLRRALERAASKLVKQTRWIEEEDFEREARKLTDKKIVRAL